MHISFLHSYSMSGVIYIGYALFGWLAYQRAHGADYQKAASFRPRLKLVGFALMLIGLSTLTDHLSPWSLASISLAEDNTYLLYVIGALSGGLLLLLLGARIFNALQGWKIQNSAMAACFGYLLLILTKYWLYHALWAAARLAPPSWATGAQAILAEFSGTALQSIILLGFAIVLATPTLSNKPADAVSPVT